MQDFMKYCNRGKNNPYIIEVKYIETEYELMISYLNKERLYKITKYLDVLPTKIKDKEKNLKEILLSMHKFIKEETYENF